MKLRVLFIGFVALFLIGFSISYSENPNLFSSFVPPTSSITTSTSNEKSSTSNPEASFVNSSSSSASTSFNTQSSINTNTVPDTNSLSGISTAPISSISGVSPQISELSGTQTVSTPTNILPPPEPPKQSTFNITNKTQFQNSASPIFSIASNNTNVRISVITSASGSSNPIIGTANTAAFVQTPKITSVSLYTANLSGNSTAAKSLATDVQSYTASLSGMSTQSVLAPPCAPPISGDWIITTSCEMTSSQTAHANVRVENNSILTIPSEITLDIDFANFNLTIKSGSGVLIKSGGKIT